MKFSSSVGSTRFDRQKSAPFVLAHFQKLIHGTSLLPTAFIALFVLAASLSMNCEHSLWAQQPAAADQDDEPKLTTSIRRQLDQFVVPALNARLPEAVYQSFTPLILKCKPEVLVEIEKYLESKSPYKIQSTYADAIVQRIEAGMDTRETKGSTAVAAYTIGGISHRIDEFLADVDEHPMMQDPAELPEEWKDNRKYFWDAHVYKNEFTNKIRLAEFAAQVMESQRQRIEKRKRPTEIAALKKLEELKSQLPIVEKKLIVREAELRLIRFNRSYDKLEAKGDFESRLVAAICLEMDGEVLLPLFDQYAAVGFDSRELSNPTVVPTIQQKLNTARLSKDNITRKATLFRRGLHWWLRGRYGFGPMANGLLKNPGAMQSADAMVGLFMPGRRPNPISPYHEESEVSPGFERRHFYTWAVEYRPMTSSMDINNDVTSEMTASVPLSKKCYYFW